MGLRDRFELAKTIIAKHYPDQAAAPDGLLVSMIKALGEAELRGFDECMLFFKRQNPPDNDDGKITSPSPHKR